MTFLSNKKLSIYVLAVMSLAMLSCNFNKSTSVDFISGLTSNGDGLSVDNIYLSDGNERIDRTEFIYGEKFYLNFNNITGFKKENNFVFPGMEFTVLNKAGDTIMHNEDLYANEKGGYNIAPLALNSSLIVARPIVSGETYTTINRIWDKKGEGTFSAEMDFTVVSNPNVKIENDGLTAREVYVTSITKDDILTEPGIEFNEQIQLNIEGLMGFESVNDKTSIAMSMKVTDDDGNNILLNNDLLGESPLSAELVKQNLAATLVLQPGRLTNPITVLVHVKDRATNSSLTIKTQFTVNKN